MSKNVKILKITPYFLIDMFRSKNVFGIIANNIPRDAVPVDVSISNNVITMLLSSKEYPEVSEKEDIPLIDALPIFQAVREAVLFYQDVVEEQEFVVYGAVPVGAIAEAIKQEHPAWKHMVIPFNQVVQ